MKLATLVDHLCIDGLKVGFKVLVTYRTRLHGSFIFFCLFHVIIVVVIVSYLTFIMLCLLAAVSTDIAE